MLSYAGVAQSMKKSSGATKDLGLLLTPLLIQGITFLVKKCFGSDSDDTVTARARLQEYADAYFAGETPDAPRGFAKLCKEHGIRGAKEQKRTWMLYLSESFREPDNAALILAKYSVVGSTLGEDASAVPPEPAPLGSPTSPPPPFNMGGDPPKPVGTSDDALDETEPFRVFGDDNAPADGSSSSSSSHE